MRTAIRKTGSKNVEDLNNSYGRLWFVAILGVANGPKEIANAVLDQSLENIQDVTLQGLHFRVMSRPEGRIAERIPLVVDRML